MTNAEWRIPNKHEAFAIRHPGFVIRIFFSRACFAANLDLRCRKTAATRKLKSSTIEP
jgi:hypothetical protein